MRRFRSPSAVGTKVVLAALVLAGCESPQQLGPTSSVADYIPRVSTANGTIAAVLRTGDAPAAGAGAAPTVPAAAAAVNGGSAQVAVTAGAEFTTVIVAVQGAADYWELTLPAGVAASDVVLGVARQATAGTIRVQYAVGDGSAVGSYANQLLQVYRVGNGDVQVSISWTGASDVDLHVIDPSGEEVYFGNLTSASGGRLDLDSNAGCQIDNKNNENIVWPVGGAPSGEYRVVVDYWDDCGVARSDYVVTVQVTGQEAQVFSGSFVGEAALNPDAEIVTFTY
jgi:uncharacterized protein YfaP (DUF2135 family)